MKKIFSYIIFFIIGINVFGFSGNLSGEKDLKIIKTKWLDIIYPESCQESAKLLQENGDEIFLQVTNQYGLTPDFHLPVVITPTVDLYNAFYTPAPYNRIVLFDTSTSTLDDLSSSFSENLLSTFRHELTHAVTYNMKNGFWKGVTDVLGDVMVPGYFFVTSGMAEGAAVASESIDGEGRLNDEFAKHFVKQAKIEGKFPEYYDVQGAGDNMIPGIQYYFNGAFHKWLQEKYGMEKYGDFWHKVININRPGVNWSFKKVYGTSIRKSWKEFEESYEVPQIIEDRENICTEINIKDDEGLRFKSFSKSEKGFFYIEEKSQSVFFIENDYLDGKVKPKKILSQKGIDNVSVSRDGRVMGVSYFSNKEPTITGKIKLYDCKKHQHFSVAEDGLKNGKLMQWNGDYYLICHNYNSPCNTLLVYKIIFNNDTIVNTQLIYSEDQELNTFVSDFTDLGNGTFGFIEKSKKSFSICIIDLRNFKKTSFTMPEDISMRNLSENNGTLFFSWTKKGTMPRLGFFNIEAGELFLSTTDISGGVFYPLVFGNADAQRVIFMGNFYDESKLFRTYINSQFFTKGEKTILNPKYNEIKNKADAKGTLIGDNYKWYKNLYGGLIIPFSLYTSSSIPLPFGVTFATSNPWSNGSDDLIIFSAGWGYLTNSFGIETVINKGSATSLYSYNLDLKTEFDKKGWKGSSGYLQFGSGINFGEVSSLIFENDFNISGGKRNNNENNLLPIDLLQFWKPEVFESFAPKDDKIIFDISDFVMLTYSNISKKGPGRFQYGGITFSTGIGYIFNSDLGQGMAFTSSFGGKIPGLLPINQKKGLVYNLPLKFNFTLLPLASAYGLTGATYNNVGYGVIDFFAETVLFGLDIQKAIPYFDILFLQDFSIKAGYSSTITSYKGTKRGFQIPYIFEYLSNLGNGKSLYLDSVYFRADLNFAANVGVLANAMFNSSLFVELLLPINNLPGKKKYPVFNFGYKGLF